MTFSCEFRDSFLKDSPVTKTYNMTVDGTYLPDILEDFESFLRGCGFHFDGIIDIVPPEEDDLEIGRAHV